MTACDYCGEPIVKGDTVSPIKGGHFHHECGFRMCAGSVAHIQKRCSCFVHGSQESDPPGLTKRQAAKAALDAWNQGWNVQSN